MHRWLRTGAVSSCDVRTNLAAAVVAPSVTDQIVIDQDVTIEVWSDVACPWCYIGKTRFLSALNRF